MRYEDMIGVPEKSKNPVIPEKGSHPKWAKKSFKINYSNMETRYFTRS